jgi:hypothetical protein
VRQIAEVVGEAARAQVLVEGWVAHSGLHSVAVGEVEGALTYPYLGFHREWSLLLQELEIAHHYYH